jgi:PAS domain S-box-containing protein
VFRFDREVDFAGGTGALAVRLAEHGALALDRAIAYDGEHRARLDLERGQDRLAFLVLASHRLAARSDIGSSLSDVADLAVPRLADWCAIEVSDLDLPILAIAPGDRRAAIARLGSLAPWSLGHWLVPGLTRDGVALLTAERAWPGGPADPGVGATLRDLSTRALLAAVITGDDGAPIGSILLGATDENRFMPTDVSLVRDLADRVATAVRETRLFAAVARFKATVDQSADAVFMFDPHTLRLTYVNRGGADLAGREPAALMDRSILELQPDGTGSGFQRLITDRPGGQPGGPLAHRSAILRADGREVPIEAVVQEVTLGDGSTSVILTARDISDRIDVQARLTRIAGDERRQAAELRAVLQAMGEGILVVGPHGSISLANETAIAILGADMPADLGELLRRLGLGTAELRNEELEAGAAAAGAEPRVARLEDGRWLEIASYPAELGSTMGDEPTSSIVVIRDVTRAKEADAAQEAFLGVLSHELRTPVTTIYGYSKMLQRPTRDEDRAEMLSDIEVEADRLYRIVEDLLALSRVEGGISIDGEPLLVQHLVGPVVASEAQRWLSTRFEIDLPPGLPPVFGERTYVEQVVRNLVSNAGKYGRAGSVATVTAEATPTEVLVRVLDRGIGIQAGEAERLFDLYYRSPNSARSATGAGIGLYVGRGLVTAMGGRIWARPRVGGGSEFGFSLPRCEEDAMPAGEADRAR